MDGDGVEVPVVGGVVRKAVDPPVLLGGGVRLLARRPRRDVQTRAEQQREQHRRITGRAEVRGMKETAGLDQNLSPAPPQKDSPLF